MLPCKSAIHSKETSERNSRARVKTSAYGREREREKERVGGVHLKRRQSHRVRHECWGENVLAIGKWSFKAEEETPSFCILVTVWWLVPKWVASFTFIGYQLSLKLPCVRLPRLTILHLGVPFYKRLLKKIKTYARPCRIFLVRSLLRHPNKAAFSRFTRIRWSQAGCLAAGLPFDHEHDEWMMKWALTNPTSDIIV